MYVWIDQFYSYMEMDSRALKPVFKKGFLGMGVVLRGGAMRFKMSWYGCGFKSEFNEIQDVLVWEG